MSFGESFGDLFGDPPEGWSIYEHAIVRWLIAATGLPAGKVILAEQDGPRPAVPFMTVRSGALIPLGVVDELETQFDSEAENGQEIATTVRGLRELRVTVQGFSAKVNGDVSARAMLSLAQLSLRLPTIRAELAEAGLTVVDIGQILPIPVILDTKWEGRAALDVGFHLEETVTVRTGYIAATELEDQIVEPYEMFTIEFDDNP